MISSDNRLKLNASLQILREQRKLFKSTMDSDSNLTKALYEKNNSSTLNDLYLEVYFTEWYLGHWEQLMSIISNDNTHTMDCKKELVLYFANGFKEHLKDIKAPNEQIEAELSALKRSLESMLYTGEKWEKAAEELHGEIIKMKAKCKNELEEIKKRGR